MFPRNHRMSEVKSFDNGLLVLDAIGDARVTRPSSETLTVLNPEAHIERYLKSFGTIRISCAVSRPGYRFRANVTIKYQGRRVKGGFGMGRECGKETRGYGSLRRAPPAAIHIRYQVLTTTARTAEREYANINYGCTIMPASY